MAEASNSADPKGLIRESYRIDGIAASECRSIFMDWVLSLPDGADTPAALDAMIEGHAAAAPDHPMSRILAEARQGAAMQPRRRGGRGGRLQG